MRELRSEEIGDRRVALVETETERYSVAIAVQGPHGAWEDISLQRDQNLVAHHSDFGGLPPAIHIDVSTTGGSHEQEICC